METLSVRLKRLRVTNGLAVKEVAEKIGVPLTTYREWENGRKILGEPYIDLANIFGVSVYELIAGEQKSSAELRISFEIIEKELLNLKQSMLSK